jgi:ParB-like chromosome segregation protein Spo0J
MKPPPRGFDPTGGFNDKEEEPVVALPTAPTVTKPTEPSPVQAVQTAQTETQRIALELADQWRRVQGGEVLPRPISPPLAPAGHAALPSLTEQRAAFGMASPPSSQSAPSQSTPVAATTHGLPATTLPRPVVPDPAIHAAAIGVVASPDAAPAVERREPATVLSVQGHEVILPLDAVLCDPKRNYARGGVAWKLDDQKVIKTANSIEVFGLKNPIGVRVLDPPIERDAPADAWIEKPDHPRERVLVTHYTHQVVDGFKRFAALQLLKRSTGRFTENEITPEIALLHNGVENIDRTELNDYQLGQYFAQLGALTGWNSDEVAAAVNAPQPARVATLMMIMERLPEELLEVFRCSPTPEIRRDMTRIAKIQRETKEETHQAMVDEWLRLEEERPVVTERKREEKEKEKKRNGRSMNGEKLTYRTMNRSQIEHFRTTARHATEWYDAMHGEWRPIDDEARAYCDAMLRRVSSPKGKPVLR